MVGNNNIDLITFILAETVIYVNYTDQLAVTSSSKCLCLRKCSVSKYYVVAFLLNSYRRASKRVQGVLGLRGTLCKFKFSIHCIQFMK